MQHHTAYLAEIAKTRAVTERVGTRDLEHQHRPALRTLLQAMLPGTSAINEPGKIDFGAPDFALIRGGLPVGYVETKRLGEDLGEIAKGEQLGRYFGYANLVLTNYLEFRFYKHGEAYSEPIAIADLATLTPDDASCTLLETTLRAFLEDAAEPVRRAGRLAKIMGENGKRIRANLARFLRTDSPKNAPLLDIYGAFKSQLIHDLSLEDFADMYAQTLVYGLFVARYHDESAKDFSRAEARELIPQTNPLLRRFFDHIAGADFDDRLKPIVDEICQVFGATDVRELMRQMYAQDLWGATQAGPDPVIHFYEDFLREYDPAARKKLGAYYTPPAVVRFIVRSVDAVLKRDFGLARGLADAEKIAATREVQGKRLKDSIHRVQVLDPATGTGTFLNEVVRYVRASFAGQEGRFAAYAREDLLPRLHGFELMMAPYTIAHLKLAATLRESGASDLGGRLGVYLTNSLEGGHAGDGSLFSIGLGRSISEEGIAASRVKGETPVMVVVGNPPYAGESSNRAYTGHDVYKLEPGGGKLKERNSKWINDDYVKFIRLAESLIERTGEGVVGLITAHGYLDNPTFRGMRYHLMQTFSEIYVLDLHGNSNKKEKAPDGGKDENVFSIKQGVAVLIGVRRKGKREGALAAVYRADCYGGRRAKLECLDDMNFEGEAWAKILPSAPNYEWVVRDESVRKKYEAGFSLAEMFPVSSVGIVTSRDGFVIDADREVLKKRIQDFLASTTPQEALSKFGLRENLKWKAASALKHPFDEAHIVPVSYRPFDSRFVYYHNDFIERSRPEVMRHFANHQNVGLVANKRIEGPRDFADIFLTESVTDARRVSLKETNYVFPLFLLDENGVQTPNISPELLRRFAATLGGEPAPIEILDYTYAILHSPSYRAKYADFLKTDFPRVPYPKDKDSFAALAALGAQLRALHLLESPAVQKPITTYPLDGGNFVEKVRRDGDRVYVNATQHFGGVPDEAWNLYIGGYQPAQKWLKDRVGRTLSSDEIDHYQKIIVALIETGRIMRELDRLVII